MKLLHFIIMPYVQPRYIQRPYQTLPAYIQRGGGFFSALLDSVKNKFMPWAMSFGKTIGSSLSAAAKSKQAKRLTRKATKAVTESLAEAGGNILQGQKIGEAVKSSAEKTKNKIIKAVQDEAYKKGEELKRAYQTPIPSVQLVKKSAPKKRKAKAKAPDFIPPKKTAKGGFTLI